MADFEKLGVFYLGRRYDLSERKAEDELLLYPSKDLVTHAVCVGMTGSGKTGLCISLLEEAAIDGIPALVIDPKGDLANLLLTFPNLAPEDFAPWVNPEDAARKGIPADQYPAQQAQFWREGLARWGQDGERIARLKAAADFTIYTPGSTAGRPVSVLKSFAAPSAELAADREQLRDRTSATSTALLALIGIDADPIQSREHILISTLLDAAWRDGRDLDLAAMIHQIQSPPFQRVGVLDLEAFYPAKDRFRLAMAINNLLASPGFEVWLEGDPLDVSNLLYTPRGKPRVSIFSIAHLSDAERMFFVSLLLNQTLSWMRAQPGTTSLRAILYMDEIFGYFPPVANPPSKTPLLTLLKQARAFGLGVVLATQNPVDLDYKGLSNAGTWFIGRLQTDRDKQRVLDGLEGAAASQGGRFDRGRMEQILAGLGNRVFLMNNVNNDAPEIFETRWAMSYLRGPLTRAQIKLLTGASAAPQPAAPPKPAAPAAAAKPVIPPGIEERFVPVRGSAAGLTYEPVILGAAQVRFVDPKRGVDLVRDLTLIAPIGQGAVPVNWGEAAEADFLLDELETAPAPQAGFADLPPAASQAKNYKTWAKDLQEWIYANHSLDLFYSPSVGQTSAAGESERDFRLRLVQAAREYRDTTIEALRAQYATRMKPLEDRIFRARQALERERQQAQSKKFESVLSIGAGVLGALFGGRRTGAGAVVQGAKTIGRAYKEGQDVDRAGESVERLEEQLAAFKQELEQQVAQIQSSPDPLTEPLETIPIKPKKTNISVRLTCLVWKT